MTLLAWNQKLLQQFLLPVYTVQCRLLFLGVTEKLPAHSVSYTCENICVKELCYEQLLSN